MNRALDIIPHPRFVDADAVLARGAFRRVDGGLAVGDHPRPFRRVRRLGPKIVLVLLPAMVIEVVEIRALRLIPANARGRKVIDQSHPVLAQAVNRAGIP